MKKERIRKRRANGFGKFVLGWFTGFISTLLIIGGVGYWAYTSISVGTIEKWTKSNIAGKNEGVRKLTLQDAVGIATGIAKGSGNYTLAKFEEDFGINLLDDTFMGMDLSKLKNSPLKEIKTAFEDTIDAATFNNILTFMEVDYEDLGLLKTVLESEVTYYVNNGKLYIDEDYATEVDFGYTIENGDVKLDTNASDTIVNNKVSFALSNLPLTNAVNSMSDATKDLKISEIMDYHYDNVGNKYYKKYENGVYSDPVSGVMGAIADFTIDELSDQSKIDKLKIHEVMGYYYNDTDKSYYTTSTFDNGTKVAGVMNALAGNTLGDLSKEDTFNNLYIYQVMGYTQVQISSDPIAYKYTDKNGDVTGIMSTLAGKTVGGLDDKGAFNDILLVDALGYTVSGNKVYNGETEVTGVVKHLVLKNSSISTIASDVKTLTIQQILDINPEDANTSSVIKALCNKNSTIDTLNNDIKTLTLVEILGGNPDNNPIINALATSTISTMATDINNLTLGSALGVAEESATGVVKTFYHTPITGLADEIQNIKIWQAMGYYEKVDGGNKSYYLNYDETNGYSNLVTGLMGSLAKYSVNELSNSSTFEDLYIYDVMGYYYNENDTTWYKTSTDLTEANKVSGIMLMLEDAQLKNIESEIDKIINRTKLSELFEKGVIDGGELSESTKNVIGNKTMPELMEFIDTIPLENFVS